MRQENIDLSKKLDKSLKKGLFVSGGDFKSALKHVE